MEKGILRNNEEGITLIEVVVSILLISILLISFYGMFIQSKKTNSSAEATGDATYLAQTEMEKIYQLSTKLSLSKLNGASLPGYTLKSSNSDSNIKACDSNENKLIYNEYSSIFTYEKSINQNFKSVITIKPLCNFDKSSTVIIEIINKNNVKKAILENVYVWR